MTRDVTEKSSLDRALEQARAFGASVEETRRIHEVVSANTSPEVLTFEMQFGPDSSNNRAVWVHLLVEEDLKAPREKISRLNKIATQVRQALLSANLSIWPYVDVRSR